MQPGVLPRTAKTDIDRILHHPEPVPLKVLTETGGILPVLRRLRRQIEENKQPHNPIPVHHKIPASHSIRGKLNESPAPRYTLASEAGATDSASVNAERVARRYALGGHDVPQEKIVARYARSIANVSAALPYLSRAFFFDNSGAEMRYLASYSEEDGVDLLVPESDLPKWFMVATSKEQQK